MRQAMKECSVIDSVARPGPPPVSTFGRSMILNASISRISTTVAATGAIAGQVMSRKIWKPLAPSSRAASTWSRGWFSIAASSTMNMNGVHCQVSPISTISRADQASVAQDHSPRPKAAQSGANGPFCMSASMRNM